MLQLGDQQKLRASYERRKTFRQEIKGARGRILDRNGRTLALDVGKKHIGIDPSYIAEHSDAVGIQNALAAFLPVEPASIASDLSRTGKRYKVVQGFVDATRAKELQTYLAEQELKGVVFDDVQARKYPQGSLMSHVLGYANREGKGCSGIELRMNRFLHEKRGMLVGEKDGGRRERLIAREVEIDAEDGADVLLTLDQYLQFSVEHALKTAVEERNAAGAWAVILDSRTSAVLAMASYPDFDPNLYFDSDKEDRRNRAISMLYEPGSIMKPITFAAAMNEGLVDPNEIIDTEDGVWMFRKRPLRDYHGYSQLTAADVLKKSSNIGTAKIGLRLGDQRFDDYLRAFGFGTRTGINLPGEGWGIMPKVSRWDSLTLSRMSMGHSISVTALQMAAAMNVIASDGNYRRPYLVKEVREHDGFVRFRKQPEIVRAEVIRPDVARDMRELMARITEAGGTGRRAAVEGYRVAGKTGTAEKVINGQYSDTKNIASFAGFLPAENPAITIVVSVDEPTGKYRTGGVVAGPVFREIAESAVRYLGIPAEGF